MATLPDFQMDLTGEYCGNAYPESAEYRIRIVQVDDGTEFLLTVENSSGGLINSIPLTEEDADGIDKVATTMHGLEVYDDDWQIPVGIERTVQWDLSDNENIVRLGENGISEVNAWLRYALGFDTYDGNPDEWEY